MIKVFEPGVEQERARVELFRHADRPFAEQDGRIVAPILCFCVTVRTVFIFFVEFGCVLFPKQQLANGIAARGVIVRIRHRQTSTVVRKHEHQVGTALTAKLAPVRVE